MADPDIPLAYGVPLPPPQASAPVMPTGAGAHHLPPGAANPNNDQPLSASTIQLLLEQGYTTGLAQALQKNKQAFAQSIWIVDNSGSMQTEDGQRIVPYHGAYKFVHSTRWTEMVETVDYHSQLAALLQSPTTFRLLNDPGRVAGPQQFSIAAENRQGADAIDSDLAVAQQTMANAQPGGVTPLVPHLHEIRDELRRLEPQLRANGSKVAIVLATDGLPTDAQGYHSAHVKQQFVDALRQLEALPVWIVVRLCTDEDAVVEYYNNLDAQLELSLEVLDDIVAEAKEVCEQNKWLTYGLPLHRMREHGFHHRLFDLLDERKLSKGELRQFFRLLFGSSFDEAPDPEVDWEAFVKLVGALQGKEKKVWNPITRKVAPWVDVKKLNKEYGHGGFFGLW